MEPLTRALHKKWVMRVHNIHECDADIPTLLRVPPSKINSKESLEEGDDHLSWIGRSAERPASAQVSLWHIILLWCAFECKYQIRSRIWSSSVTSHSMSSVRTTVMWSDRFCSISWSVLQPSRDRFCRHRHKNVAESGIFFVLFPSSVLGAKKEREKKGESSWSQVLSTSALCSLILHPRSCRMQIIVANLLLYYHYIISLKSSCPATSFAFEQESRMLAFWIHPRRS